MARSPGALPKAPSQDELRAVLAGARVLKTSVRADFRRLPAGWAGADVSEECLTVRVTLKLGPDSVLVGLPLRMQRHHLRKRVLKAVHESLRMADLDRPAAKALDAAFASVMVESDKAVREFMDGPARVKADVERQKRRGEALASMKKTMWEYRGVLSEEDVMAAWSEIVAREVMEA